MGNVRPNYIKRLARQLVAEMPEAFSGDFEANKEVIEILASTFNLPKTAVKIIRGEKSRQKVVSLEDVNKKARTLK